ncbi:sulfotransferase domain-containing protein [uncultured Aquimarina sp.]|uniref:sulfotransferase domain-containing protein n=1 Tax=uncultured Aquimarina sp. TaxID=575652 RepID=UPI00262E7DB4|nr:sulfotransferase domain-containing protein [uncultured Aquimarina sp.]
MKKKNIIVTGYPKSGTTWASRLIAELASCPLQGDWGFDDIEALYKEGKYRDSPYECYKTHYIYNDIFSKSSKKVYKIVHIIRDPRDIVISGSHYFNFTNLLQKIIKSIGLSIDNSSFFSVSQKKRKQKMIQAILYGDSKVNHWLSLSWKKHTEAFKGKEVLTIKYEDLLITPQKECAKIATYLQLNIDILYIDRCIQKQSFEKKKKEMTHTKDAKFKKLLRQGKQGYWKEEFTVKEKSLFKEYLQSSTFYQ